MWINTLTLYQLTKQERAEYFIISIIIVEFGNAVLIFFVCLFKLDFLFLALQNFVVFCQTSTWISHRYTYIPSLLNLPPIFLSISPLQVDTEPLFEFPDTYSKFPLTIYFTYGNVSFHVTLSIHLTLSSPLPMSISLFSMSVSLLLACK